jgi:hypothetical protein
MSDLLIFDQTAVPQLLGQGVAFAGCGKYAVEIPQEQGYRTSPFSLKTMPLQSIHRRLVQFRRVHHAPRFASLISPIDWVAGLLRLLPLGDQGAGFVGGDYGITAPDSFGFLAAGQHLIAGALDIPPARRIFPQLRAISVGVPPRLALAPPAAIATAREGVPFRAGGVGWDRHAAVVIRTHR